MHRVSRSLKKFWRFVRKHKGAIVIWGMSAFFVLCGLFALWAATLQIPDLQSLSNRVVEQSLKIYDRTGTVLLYDVHKRHSAHCGAPQPAFPQSSTCGALDRGSGFYQHGGIEPKAIVRAVVSDILSIFHLGVPQGGSTITQQVVKSTILTNDKTISRKFKEWILAIKMEQVFTKDQILELYLNQIPFGGSVYGAEQASETFFGKHASDLSVPEAAYLAAVLPAPTYYSPFGNHKDALDARKNLVLDKMVEHGYLTQAEGDAAKAAVVTFQPPRDVSIQAPHFVFYVEQYLEDKYGPDALETGGWKVTTTLDADMQVQAENIVRTNALSNTDKFNASNAALIAIDPTNGKYSRWLALATTLTPRSMARTTPLSRHQVASQAQPLSHLRMPKRLLRAITPTLFSLICARSSQPRARRAMSPTTLHPATAGQLRRPSSAAP